MTETTPPAEPRIGDYIVMFDTEPEDGGEPAVLLVRVTTTGFEGIGEGWIEQTNRIETRARFPAYEQSARAWRHGPDGYAPLPPYYRPDVH